MLKIILTSFNKIKAQGSHLVSWFISLIHSFPLTAQARKRQCTLVITPKPSKFFILIKKIFNRHNLTKVLIIFIVGFSIRLFLNIFYGINVFTDFLTITSLTFYSFMSCFAIVVHECVTLFSFSIFPSSFCSSLNYLFSSLNPFTLFNKYSSLFFYANSKIKSLFCSARDLNFSCIITLAQENKLSFMKILKDYFI